MPLRALAWLLASLCLATSSGCATRTLWYGPDLFGSAMDREARALLRTRFVAPERIAAVAVERDELAVALRWEGGHEEVVGLGITRREAAELAGATALVAPDGRQAVLGPYAVALWLPPEGGGHELRLSRGERLIRCVGLAWKREAVGLNPGWFLALLATPLALAVDLATAPIQALLYLLYR